MPTLIHQTEIRIEWSDINNRIVHVKPANSHVRSSGVHLSGIIKHCMNALGKWDKNEETDEMPLCMAMGMAWEDWAVGLWTNNFKWQPGEWEEDEVFGTPDGTSFYPAPDANMVDEFKATWKSPRTRPNILNETGWMWQLAGNCYALGLEYARLHVLWVNGNQAYYGAPPVYMVYYIKFSQSELGKFWNNIVLKNRDQAIPEKH